MRTTSKSKPGQLLVAIAIAALFGCGDSAAARAAEDITAHVLEIDRPAKCLQIDWHNDTKRKVCWTAETKFTVLETEKSASAGDVRVGSYLHVIGEERDGALRAASIEIWESAAKPETP